METVTDDDDEPLDFEAWSSTAARLLQRSPEERDRILDEAGITPDVWAVSELHWARTLGEELGAGDFARGHRHGARCAEELAGRAPEGATKEPEPQPETAAEEEEEEAEPVTLAPQDLPAPLLDLPPPPSQPALALAYAPAPAAPEPPPPAAMFPGALPSPEQAGTTVDLSELLRRGPPLPFAPGRPAAAFGPPAAVAAPSASGDTMDVSEAMRGRDIPFGAPPPAPPSGPRLSLEQYASLTVELARAPAHAVETLLRYGVVPAQRDALDAEWRARLTDERERAGFEGACAAYRAWLAQHAR